MGLHVHSDGWITLPGADGTTVHVRAQSNGQRTMITDIYLHTEDGIAPTALRGLSISRLEAEIAVACSPRSSLPFSEIPTLSAIFKAAPDEDDGTPEPTLAELRARTPLAKAEPPPPRPHLTRPDGTDPDEFYWRVARAYYEYAAQTRAPAKEMAAEAGAPVTTVHRWIREARRREFLPPAIKGRAG